MKSNALKSSPNIMDRIMSEIEKHFSVVQFIDDAQGGEMSECVGGPLDAKEAVELAHSYCTRPAARLRIIKRVRIIYSGDCCCFEWQYGKGITFR